MEKEMKKKIKRWLCNLIDKIEKLLLKSMGYK